MQANDFSQLLDQLSSSERDAHRYRDNGSVVDLTYGVLIAEADRLGRGMHRLGVRRGDRVGLVLHRAQDFVPAFLGCVRAGFIAVPLYPPLTLGQLASWAETTGRMLATARASLLLADAPVAYTLRSLRDEIPSMRDVVTIDDLPDGGELPFGAVSDGDVVFLQFTSGSTAAPPLALASSLIAVVAPVVLPSENAPPFARLPYVVTPSAVFTVHVKFATAGSLKSVKSVIVCAVPNFRT